MQNVTLLNLVILFMGLIILLISLTNYTYAIAIWLVLFPIVGQIKGFDGWEIFPMERILNTLLCGIALIKIKVNWKKLPDASLFIYYLWFIFVLVLSSIFSEIPIPALGRTLTFTVPLMMGIMVLAAIQENENGLRMIIGAMILGFSITIAFAVVELLLQKNFLVDMGVLPWDEDYLSDIRFGISGRISSFIGQPVYAALYFMTTIPLILFYRKYYVRNSTMKLIYAILFALGIMMIFLTGTRSVYLFFAVAPFIYLYYKKGKKIFSSSFFYIYLLVLVFLPFLLPQKFIDFTMESFQAVNPLNVATTSSFYGRLELTEFFWDLFKEHVLLGFGPGFIQRMAAEVAMFRNLRGMENQYAGLLVESGIIGLSTFMLFSIKFIKMTSATCQDDDPFTSDWAIMTSSIFTLVMLIAVSVYIANGPIMNYLMMYLAIMIGVKAHCEAAVGEFDGQDSELPISNGSENGAPLLQGE
jgi:hypothetical protein